MAKKKTKDQQITDLQREVVDLRITVQKLQDNSKALVDELLLNKRIIMKLVEPPKAEKKKGDTNE